MKKRDIKSCSCAVCKNSKGKCDSFKAAHRASRRNWKQRGETKIISTGYIG